jgi:hypothetical protein
MHLPTQLSTVNAIFEKSLSIADDLDLETVVLVFDQALYAKAQEVRWHNEQYKKRTVLRLGELHACLSFLSVIGKRFTESGLEDMFVASGVIAAGSMINQQRHHRP